MYHALSYYAPFVWYTAAIHLATHHNTNTLVTHNAKKTPKNILASV